MISCWGQKTKESLFTHFYLILNALLKPIYSSISAAALSVSLPRADYTLDWTASSAVTVLSGGAAVGTPTGAALSWRP